MLSAIISESRKEREMGNNVYDAKVSKGRLELSNLPFADGADVRVVVIPKYVWDEERLQEIQKLTSGIKGNLSDVILEERGSR